MNQLQMKVAVLEQEVKDKEQLMRRTKEVLEAAQQQKVWDMHLLWTFRWCAALIVTTITLIIFAECVRQESVEENAESKEVQIKKLEATVKSLSEELIKVSSATAQTRIQLLPIFNKQKVVVFQNQANFTGWRVNNLLAEIEELCNDVRDFPWMLVSRAEQTGTFIS